jgi:adenylate cyclase
MLAFRRRDLAVISALALAMAALSASPLAGALRGLSLDLAFPLRHALFGPLAPPDKSHVVVIAIDEETYRRPPFADTPQAAWPPLLAPVLNAVAPEAPVIGFDIVWSTSLDGFQRGFERDFLVALRNAARAGKLVMGKVQHSQQPILPHAGQQVAAGGGANIRALNLFEDGDGIIRRLPLGFRTAEGSEPGFAYELAQRSGLARALPAIATDAEGNLGLNFNTGSGDIPTYSLADLQACAQAGKTEYFRQHFAGKTVLFATVLDVEDRRLTAKRLATAPDGANAPPRCVHPAMGLHGSLVRDSLPGVYIHAAAINNLLDGTELRDWPTPAVFALALLLALVAALLAFRLPLLIGIAVVLGLALLQPVAAAVLLQAASVLPWLNLVAALLLSLGAAIAFRFLVSDRDKRQLAKVFSLYLPPALVQKMLASGTQPALGGEERDVTVLFSDIAGFTGISEACDPATLVQGLNTYFSAMTAIIEDHGGFVDKYIGDAIVAVFGAPLDDSKHASHAVRAALHMQAALAREPERFSIAGRPLRTRIGLNTGMVLIGNIGSPRRFNYTAIGDAVNLAARLEGANKAYGTGILASDATMAAAGDGILARPVDTVRVVGRRQPVTLFEPLARRHRAGDLQQRQAAVFADVQAALAQGELARAGELLRELPAEDAAAQKLGKRIAALPAGVTWPGVTDLTEK